MSLRRRSQLQPLRRSVLIVCEGYLETSYFTALQSHGNVNRNYILRIYCARGGKHATVVKETIKYEKSGHYRKNDIWCIFDTESGPESDQLEQSLQTCKQREFNVGLSNPCFNIWALAHLQRVNGHTTPQESLRDLESAVGGRLQVRDTDWVLDRIIGKDFSKVINAMQNIQPFSENKLEQIIVNNPSTNVGSLVRLLINTNV